MTDRCRPATVTQPCAGSPLQPSGRLAESAYRLLSGSAEASTVITAIIEDRYLAGIDPAGVLADVGLARRGDRRGDLGAEVRSRPRV
jgi:hypothetical protein